MPSPATFPAAASLGAASSQPPTIRTSALIGWRSALRTTSGPIPRGSPTATANRRLRGVMLEPDVDLLLFLQLIDEMPDRELIAQRLPDLQFDVVERDVPGGMACGHFGDRELGPRAVLGERDDRLEAERRVDVQDLRIVGRQIGDGRLLGELRFLRVAEASGQRSEEHPTE